MAERCADCGNDLSRHPLGLGLWTSGPKAGEPAEVCRGRRAEPPRPPTVEEMRKRVRNHERVALAVHHLGATELGDAEDYVLQGIDALYTELDRLRSQMSEQRPSPEGSR